MGVEAVALGTLGASAVIGVASNIAQGVQADRAARLTAEQLDLDADLALRQSKFQARQERISGEEVISSGTAITGSSGVKINRGSDLRVREVNQGRIESSITNIIFSGRLAAHKLKSQGIITRAQGKAAKTAGFINAAQSILQSATQAASISSNFGIASKLKGAGGLKDPSLGTADLLGEA